MYRVFRTFKEDGRTKYVLRKFKPTDLCGEWLEPFVVDYDGLRKFALDDEICMVNVISDEDNDVNIISDYYVYVADSNSPYNKTLVLDCICEKFSVESMVSDVGHAVDAEYTDEDYIVPNDLVDSVRNELEHDINDEDTVHIKCYPNGILMKYKEDSIIVKKYDEFSIVTAVECMLGIYRKDIERQIAEVKARKEAEED